MKHTSVLRLAFVLKVMVLILFACNLIAFFFVPGLALLKGFDGLPPHEGPPEVSLRVLSLIAGCWNWNVWVDAEDPYAAVLACFLFACGICTAVILWQAKRVLNTILKECPFCGGNAGNLKRAAVCCFLISGFALARLVWSLCYYRTLRPLASYNALFVPVFLMAGLLCLVMSALFRQAAELKAENDLTI